MVGSRVLSLALLAALCSAQNLCADINTSDSSPSADIYQSSGKCTSTCNDKYAYAVMQSSNCWCTNYTPDTASQKDGCSLPCPGYPFDMCGGKGRYSYVLVNANLIAGSKGSSSSSSSSSSSASSTSSSPSDSASPSAQSTPAPSVSPQVTTVDGVARTVTIVPTQTGDTNSSGSNDSGIKVPTMLGIIFGCIGGVAVIAIGIIWFFFRRKQEDGDAAASVSTPGRSGGTSRSSMDNLSNPFSDSRAHGLYSWRNRSGSLEFLPEKSTTPTLRVANPDRT
ncbi:Cell wall integrity and stress response component 4 [Metarhizium acridum]|uniref:Cell wall integrity and stress response component 4 n=1 Tax=Metarhizium acridum TaxID=92637 RepID=UPI001C6BF7C5|nr:Cell wall integrity and stress response component 4 [Metarhizium acridum]